MAQRPMGFVVMLNEEVKETQLDDIKNALMYVKGVAQVTSINDSAIERRIKSEILESLWAWCQENLEMKTPMQGGTPAQWNWSGRLKTVTAAAFTSNKSCVTFKWPCKSSCLWPFSRPTPICETDEEVMTEPRGVTFYIPLGPYSETRRFP